MRTALILGVAVALALIAWFGFRILAGRSEFEMVDPTLPQICRDLRFESVDYVVCEVDPRVFDIKLHRVNGGGSPLRSLAALAKMQPFLFGMNAGMYHEDMSPVGLHVEEGVEHAPLNLADGEGNFFLKPNGVFYVDRDGAGVLESGAFATARPEVRAATQSGPMLVNDGMIHPRFEPDGSSRYIRNGVGVRPDGVAAFAISRGKVSLGSFARLFRDELKCPNALFFDGAISALHDGTHYVVGGEFPAGPMLTVSRKEGD